ncbi:dihydrodipicolinate reductase [Plastorhodobacter daqingensis]|uniref:Dihydrodipicolinate reductase n=1 Tax=Plastorhodobacter daqingensis TaxID=1387281 RepID=A0ABW2ULW3_9RHOB
MPNITLVATLLAGLCLACAAQSDDFSPVLTEEEFLEHVTGRELARLGVRLRVSPDGGIEGSGFGFQVSGRWDWRDGFFCRTLRYGTTELPLDCQRVKRRGDVLRFVSAQGQGEMADLRLR